MSFFKKLLGKKPTVSVESTTTRSGPATAATSATPLAAGDPAKDPDMVRVFDGYGRELFITKQQWRDNVLLGHLRKVRDRPDELYQSIVQALQDGFIDDLVEPAEHLVEIDPIPERGATILAIIYLKKKRLDDSERVLRRYIERHGETGSILTNLAKVHAERGDDALSLATLWRGLELDPNQDNGLGWYEVLHREKEGPAAGLAALRRVAALPGSWRARLWLARDALGRRQLDEALALHREALALAGRPVPADLLMQLSGDLGNAAHLPELLALTTPYFDLAVHGLAVGNNLLKANLDLGRLDAARALLDQLYAQKRPDWKPHLDHWEGELARARVATASFPPEAKLEIVMLHGDGPVWLPPDSPAAELFPLATGERLRVAFLGSSGEKAAPSSAQIEAQLSDAPGRLSRALPLFLAEQAFFRGHAQVRPLVPWARGDTAAFVFCGVPWRADEAAQHARRLDPPADYVVVTHLQVAAEPWRAELRLVRTIDAAVLGTAAVDFSMSQPEPALTRLVAEMLQLLQREAGFEPAAPPPQYRLPAGPGFGAYLLRLEQLLAVRCHSADAASAHELHGEREILDGDIHLCLDHPDSLVPRLVLVQTLQRLHQIRPSVTAEYREKIELLQKNHPLPAPAHGVLQRLLAEVYP